MTTKAEVVPRTTALPCMIIISSVTPSVVGRPCKTMPTLSPTKVTSQCLPTNRAIGVVYAVKVTKGTPPLRAKMSDGRMGLACEVALMCHCAPLGMFG